MQERRVGRLLKKKLAGDLCESQKHLIRDVAGELGAPIHVIRAQVMRLAMLAKKR